MSDRNDVSFNNGEEEEFHITDDDIDRELAAMEEENAVKGSDEALSEVSPKPSESKSRLAVFKNLKRKHWIIIAIIIIVLLMGLLKMVGNKSSSNDFDQIVPSTASSVKTSVPKKNQTDLIQSPQQNPSPISEKSDLLMSSTETPAPASSASVPTDLTRARLKSDISSMPNVESKLTQTLEAIQQQNVQLTQQLVEMNSRVQTLESAFNQSNQAVEGLAQQVVQLQSNPLNAKKPEPAKKFMPTPAVDDEKPQYIVEAVVPQRAWLQTAEGRTVTVMVGDSLPGLGTVATIDPYSGNVTMSSGKVLKYAA